MSIVAAVKNADSGAGDGELVIDLREYLFIVKSHLLGIISFAVIFSFLCILVIFSIVPVYRSEVTLLIEADEAKIVSIDDVYKFGTGNNNEYYFTQFEILKSRELARLVVERMDLSNHPAYAMRDKSQKSWWKTIFSSEEVTPEEHEQATLSTSAFLTEVIRVHESLRFDCVTPPARTLLLLKPSSCVFTSRSITTLWSRRHWAVIRLIVSCSTRDRAFANTMPLRSQ